MDDRVGGGRQPRGGVGGHARQREARGVLGGGEGAGGGAAGGGRRRGRRAPRRGPPALGGGRGRAGGRDGFRDGAEAEGRGENQENRPVDAGQGAEETAAAVALAGLVRSGREPERGSGAEENEKCFGCHCRASLFI
ncbi:MAG TPA: hypothetical protein PLZ74_02475 [Kiritimatiellia bacterium]|nr:hypothetical protein [Kiritimatiellia bacterium]